MPGDPSAFARYVVSREEKPGPLVDVGTGTGRDALWFAKQGFQTLGLDYAANALRRASSRADAEELGATFEELNLYPSRRSGPPDAGSLVGGGRGYFEFRVAETQHEFGEHY